MSVLAPVVLVEAGFLVLRAGVGLREGGRKGGREGGREGGVSGE